MKIALAYLIIGLAYVFCIGVWVCMFTDRELSNWFPYLLIYLLLSCAFVAAAVWVYKILDK